MGMVCESWNQALLEELGPVLNAPYGARCFLTKYRKNQDGEFDPS